ncbi:hypothetical protein BT96DRAFT_807226 [Gymnopus androsaceus JB14]|uniref:Retrotransposon gag domain-containing protein n=1 Tax=Gymnopus androsaceus JB14 TaxID=1447944 RepID=A0A6A4IIK2_9AGAR|nr:hypothetical protein BT96DRAFT_807226 [Gymnopus androsaceus JB14]
MNVPSGDSLDSKSKVKKPDVFDGSEPRKLKGFLVSLSLVFIDRPTYFMEAQKINYTLSYLGSAVKEWFEPDILNPDLSAIPAWTSSYSTLIQELQDNFGLYNTQGDAEDKLRNLRMKENENVQKYESDRNLESPPPGPSPTPVHLRVLRS